MPQVPYRDSYKINNCTSLALAHSKQVRRRTAPQYVAPPIDRKINNQLGGSRNRWRPSDRNMTRRCVERSLTLSLSLSLRPIKTDRARTVRDSYTYGMSEDCLVNPRWSNEVAAAICIAWKTYWYYWGVYYWSCSCGVRIQPQNVHPDFGMRTSSTERPGAHGIGLLDRSEVRLPLYTLRRVTVEKNFRRR